MSLYQGDPSPYERTGWTLKLPDWLTGYDRENAKRAEEADRQLRDLNAQDALMYGPEWAARVERDYNAQGTISVEAQDREIGEAFQQGAAEGLATMQDRFKGALNKIGLGALGFIPWWAWLIAAGWLAYKLGLFDWAKRRVARA